jgi:hypothetical protein
MEVIGLRPKTKEFIVIATQDELDKFSGIDNAAMIDGRITVGTKIDVSLLWDRLKSLTAKAGQLQAVAQTLRTRADEIESALPKEE